MLNFPKTDTFTQINSLDRQKLILQRRILKKIHQSTQEYQMFSGLIKQVQLKKGGSYIRIPEEFKRLIRKKFFEKLQHDS